MLIDTHAHVNVDAFDEDRHEVLQRARESGVEYLINIGFNEHTIPSSLALAEQYDWIYSSVGWHPQDAGSFNDKVQESLREWTKHEKVCAIGEIGLDYYWDKSNHEIQKQVFRRQLRLAHECQLPVIIHNRDAHEDTLSILQEENAQDIGGVMHCYSGSWEMASKCLELGFYISFGGPVTFKNAKQPKSVLQQVPLDRLLIETDSPYLTPHPHRGKRNEPAYVRLVAEAAAELKGISLEALLEATGNNARKLFKILS